MGGMQIRTVVLLRGIRPGLLDHGIDAQVGRKAVSVLRDVPHVFIICRSGWANRFETREPVRLFLFLLRLGVLVRSCCRTGPAAGNGWGISTEQLAPVSRCSIPIPRPPLEKCLVERKKCAAATIH